MKNNRLLAIAEGWYNFMNKKADIEEVADIRRAICEKNICKEYKTTGVMGIHCNICGCPIEKKIRSLKRSGCPSHLKLWGPVSDINLVLSEKLFERSDFLKEQITESSITYRHKKYKDLVLIYYIKTNHCSNGIINFELWKQVQEYFKDKTGKNLN